MDACAESAFLSSPIAWSSVNRMAAMGERFSAVICPGNDFSLGSQPSAVAGFNSRHNEDALAS